MNQKKLSSILAVTLSLELVISPVTPAMAVTSADVNSGLQTLTQVWNTAVQQSQGAGRGMLSPEMQGDMDALQGQQAVQPDKYFSAQKMMQIPGLGNYLALNNINPQMLDCKTLPTTIFEASPEVCRLGITNDRGMHPQAQMDQMFTYHNQYFQISKLYRNFTADSNSDGQGFGVGCMNNAMNILNGFFKYRIDELDKLTTNLEAMQNQFREASRADLDAIEEAVAVLDGDSQIADKVKTKRPDLFDFAKRFDNPACASILGADEFNKTGRTKGLNGITDDLNKKLTTKVGKYSGESYSKAHASVVDDIEKLAEASAKQLELRSNGIASDNGANEFGKLLTDLPNLTSSPNGLNRSLTPDLFVDVQTKFNDSFNKLADKRGTVTAELRKAGVSADQATQLFGNLNSSNFEAEVVTIENRIKNNCFQSSLTTINKDRLMDKIYDPTASKHANKFASNFLKDKLNSILDNNESSLEKKLADLKALETQTGSRYYMKMENSYEVQEVDDNGNLQSKVVGASTQRTPSVFFSDLIKNCNAQFKSNKLDNKMSGATAIKTLRDLHKDYKELAKANANAIKKEIRKKLVECSSPQEANNTLPGSCTPERFNPGAAGFCANAAFSCSKNMQACSKQATDYANQIKDQKTKRVQNYKALMQKNKQDMVKIFDSALARYMQDGEMLRGMFGAGFTSPTGIQREVPEGQRYLSEFQEATAKSQDGKLLLEDPDKYMAMVKENIRALKDSVKKQQDQILGGDSVGKNGGLLADHIKKTKDNYNQVVQKANEISQQCLAQHDGAIKANEEALKRQREEFAKAQKEMGEKRSEYCARFNQAVAAGNHPGPGCDGNIAELTRTVGDPANFAAYCSQTQNSSNNAAEGRAYDTCLPYKDSATPTEAVSEALQKLIDQKISIQDKLAREEAELLGAAETEKPAISKRIANLKQDIVEKDRDIAKQRGQDQAAARNSANARTESQSTIQRTCVSFFRCIAPPKVTGTGENRESTAACDPVERSSLTRAVLTASGQQLTLDSESAPAFCTAGNSDNRGGSGKSFLDGFNQGFQGPAAVGAQ